MTCVNGEFSALLREMAKERSDNNGFEKGLRLGIRLKELGATCITRDDLAVLSRMLGDEDDMRRFFAAMIIANVGPGARDAIPALRTALAERPCEDKAVTASAAIRLALRKLGENPPEATC